MSCMPEQGVKVKQDRGARSDDIKLNLAAADIRIEAPIPGKSAVGIEVPNGENSTVMPAGFAGDQMNLKSTSPIWRLPSEKISAERPLWQISQRCRTF